MHNLSTRVKFPNARFQPLLSDTVCYRKKGRGGGGGGGGGGEFSELIFFFTSDNNWKFWWRHFRNKARLATMYICN